MAEAHPVGFQWVMEAKARGAKVIHVDPRFTRTSALADTFVPLRVGTDIAFLGGVINYVLENELDFREYVVAYTNAATIVSKDFRDTEDLGGVFSGLMAYTGDADEWPFNGFIGEYEAASWKYAGGATQSRGRNADTQRSGEQQADAESSGGRRGRDGQVPSGA